MKSDFCNFIDLSKKQSLRAMKKQYNFRIEPSLLEKLKLKAKEDRRSVNASIELAIEKFCKKRQNQ